jgi:hypothetical protein
MKISKISVLIPFVFAMCFSLFSMPANAQATRTWVSGVGDDANPCSRTAPCKTFAGAISKTSAPGEINCLDPGGFGALTITKSIAIKCVGVEAGVLVSGTNGFNISAATTDVIYIEGLDFEGLNASPSGIQINTAAHVSIVNCEIRGFNTAGINVANSTSGVRVDVIDTIVADNPGEGILAKPTGSVGARVTIDRTRVLNNTGDGIMMNATATSASLKSSIRDSESADNGADGYVAFSAGADDEMMIDSSTAMNNNRGINSSGSGAIVRFTRSSITANGTGVNQVAPGQALSYTTNSVNGNGTDGTFGTVGQQ